jgi:predicted 2-oxoglutarate/Fe(II)-dependent dioxygenase YbiX
MRINVIHDEINTDLFETNNKNEVSSDQLLEKLYNLQEIVFNSIEINPIKEYFSYKVYDNILSNNLCDFIINESEKYASQNNGWITNRHKLHPTTDLPLRVIKPLITIVHNIIFFEVLPRVEELYYVNKFFLIFDDIFIVKYSYDAQNNLELHQDGSFFSFNFALNDSFEGGGTIIMEEEKEVIIKNSKGGLLIHSGRSYHGGEKITKGTRYILVGFIRYLPDFVKSDSVKSCRTSNTTSNTTLSTTSNTTLSTTSSTEKEKCIYVIGSVISTNETETNSMKNRRLDAAGSIVGLPLLN